MNREEILQQSREALEAGKVYLGKMLILRGYPEEYADEIDKLLEAGDEEFMALNNEFKELFEALDW